MIQLPLPIDEEGEAMSAAPPFDQAKPKYDALWNEMVIRSDKIASIDRSVAKIFTNKAR